MQSELSRRCFLQVLAASAAGSAGALACSAGNNGGDPEAFGDVSAGNVSALQVGTGKTVPGAPAFICRDNNGLYAMTSTCTHAGCDMASNSTLTSLIQCDCHGSQFDLNGNVTRGPASSPLTHFAVTLASDGTITVHGATKVAASTRTSAS
jgi:cytochrome b6-f complex iron-sulfur subunit